MYGPRLSQSSNLRIADNSRFAGDKLTYALNFFIAHLRVYEYPFSISDTKGFAQVVSDRERRVFLKTRSAYR
jgi:hypothetical protein